MGFLPTPPGQIEIERMIKMVEYTVEDLTVDEMKKIIIGIAVENFKTSNSNWEEFGTEFYNKMVKFSAK